MGDVVSPTRKPLHPSRTKPSDADSALGSLPPAWKLYQPERVARTRQLSALVCALSTASLISKCVLVGQYYGMPPCTFTAQSASVSGKCIASSSNNGSVQC